MIIYHLSSSILLCMLFIYLLSACVSNYRAIYSMYLPICLPACLTNYLIARRSTHPFHFSSVFLPFHSLLFQSSIYHSILRFLNQSSANPSIIFHDFYKLLVSLCTLYTIWHVVSPATCSLSVQDNIFKWTESPGSSTLLAQPPSHSHLPATSFLSQPLMERVLNKVSHPFVSSQEGFMDVGLSH